jgi:uncharacterized protein (DUF433 family)
VAGEKAKEGYGHVADGRMERDYGVQPMISPPTLKLPPFLQEQDGEIRLVGHRISIVDILRFYREGYSAEMLAARYETVTLAQIHYVIGFYLENQAAVDGYLDAYIGDCERMRKEAGPEQGRLRARLMAMREAQRKAAHVG